MKKIAISFLIIIVIFLSIFFTFIKNTLYQEWNPVPIIKWIWEIVYNKNNFVEFKDWKYIAKTKRDYLMKDFMKKNWYTFLEQMWAWFSFENKDWKKIVVTWRQFSSFFRVYYINF